MSTNRLLDCVLVLGASALVACSNSGPTSHVRQSTSKARDAGEAGSDAGASERDAGSKTSASRGQDDAGEAAGGSPNVARDKRKDKPKDDDEDAATGSEPRFDRPQDGRKFMVDEAALAFEALPDADAWSGTLDAAGYRIEVPHTWNGILVMYAHGYAGTGNVLTVTTPSIRDHLIEKGYAWAASSYSTNYYDVRAGIE